MDPNHAKAHNNLGVILAQIGNIRAASEQFARALELDPDNEDAAVNLEQARKALGQNPNLK
jgi:Flp pilus assembly protein TadD